jgi:phytoene/squalene synthetase
MLPEKQKDQQGYLRMEDARRLRRSAFWALDSATRLARMAAYSFCGLLDEFVGDMGEGNVQQHPWFSQHYGASMQCGGACVEDVVG